MLQNMFFQLKRILNRIAYSLAFTYLCIEK